MHVVITGGGGMIGRKLAQQLLRKGELEDRNGKPAEITKLTLFDMTAPPESEVSDPRIEVITGDIADPATVERMIAPDADTVYHLASVVSAGAEADFDLGYKVNLDGMRLVLERCRANGNVPKVIFASSAAAYGGEIPETVTDEIVPTPETSYGTQKVIGEYLISDYSRKGFVDGRAMRLPTIVVRPGKPNAAASGFASGIVREPLNGIDFTCPVSPESQMAIMSPRTVVNCFVHVHDVPAAELGASRALLLTGFSVSMGETVEALHRVATNRKLGSIDFKVDPHIQAIVDGWPKAMRSDKAARLGFPSDSSIEDVIAAHIEDELDRKEDA